MECLSGFKTSAQVYIQNDKNWQIIYQISIEVIEVGDQASHKCHTIRQRQTTRPALFDASEALDFTNDSVGVSDISEILGENFTICK